MRTYTVHITTRDSVQTLEVRATNREDAPFLEPVASTVRSLRAVHGDAVQVEVVQPSTMVPVTVYPSAEQDRGLRSVAGATGATVAELVRSGIEQLLTREQDTLRAAVRQGARCEWVNGLTATGRRAAR